MGIGRVRDIDKLRRFNFSKKILDADAPPDSQAVETLITTGASLGEQATGAEKESLVQHENLNRELKIGR